MNQMHLAGFVFASPFIHNHASWRHPLTDLNFLQLEFYQTLGRILEQGKLDFLFLADGLLRTEPQTGLAETLRRGSQGSILLDPTYVAATIAVATERIGLGITRSIAELADKTCILTTLDQISSGRIAVDLVTSPDSTDTEILGQEKWLSPKDRYDHADDCMKAMYETELLALQSRPVVIHTELSQRGRDFAARWADIILMIGANALEMKRTYRDIKSRLTKYDRHLEDCRVMSVVMPFVGETEAIAQEKYAFHQTLIDPIAGLQTLANQSGYDFSGYDLDQPVQNRWVGNIKPVFDIAVRLNQPENLTLRDIGRLYGGGMFVPPIIGTAMQVADQLEALFEAGAADGFVISPAFLPGAFEEFVEFVVPELQQRHLFRKEYAGRTLREHLKLNQTSSISST